MKPRAPGASRPIPITLRAMLAADCSSLPAAVRHLIHVLALHADNATGRGLTGQAQLARYMGLSTRQVRRLWASLDELWKRQESPVTALREGRWHTSDRYTLAVAKDAVLRFAREDRADSPAGTRPEGRIAAPEENFQDGRNFSAPVSNRPASRTDIEKVNRTSTVGRSDIHDRSIGHRRPVDPSQADMGVLQSTQCLALQSDRHSVLNDKAFSETPSGLGAAGSEEKATTESSGAASLAASPSVALSTAQLSAMAAARWPGLWAERADEDAFELARRREGLRRRALGGAKR